MATIVAGPSLSTHDSKILNALFDAESSTSSSTTVHATSPSLPQIADETIFLRLRAVEQAAIEPLLAESRSAPSTLWPTHAQIQQCIEGLSSLIRENPTYASAYLNRAQALRLLIASSPSGSLNEDDLFALPNINFTKELLADLSEAIALATPINPQDALSQHQRDVLAAAHTHRGFLLLKAARMLGEHELPPGDGRDCEAARRVMETGFPDVSGKSKDALEEMASRDFFWGGRYGDKMAQQMSVHTNPYAKMCGAIVKEAMRKEMMEAGLWL